MSSYWPEEFRFTLKSKNETLVLTNPPEGWTTYQSEFLFNEEEFGYSRNMSVPLKFIEEGKKFLENILSNEGFDAYCEITIERVNRTTQQYFVDFKGIINFTETRANDTFFEADIKDAGLSQKLIAYNNSKYEVPIDNEKAVDMHIEEGMNLVEYAGFVAGNILRIRNLGTNTNSLVDRKIELNISSDSEVYSEEFTFYKQTGDKDGTGWGGDTYILKKEDTNIEIGLKLSGKINYRFKATDPRYSKIIEDAAFSIYFQYETNGGKADILIGRCKISDFYTIPINAEGMELSININKFITLPKDAATCCIITSSDWVHYENSSAETMYTDIYMTGDLSCEYIGTYQTPPFSFKALRIMDFGNALTESACKENNKFSSNLLNSVNNNLFITSSDAIRGIPGALGQSTIIEFYQFVNAEYGAGMFIEGEMLHFEKKRDIWDKTKEILNVGEVTGLELSIPKEYIYNKLSIGYKNQNYDEQTGREEFNMSLNFETDIVNINDENKIISPYGTDSFGIHNIRRKYVGNNSRDSDRDNDIFAVYGRWDGSKFVVDNTIPTNLTRKGAFNVKLSPKRMLMNHYDYIASILYKKGGTIRYISSDKVDAELVAGGITEKADVSYSELGEKLFMPIVAAFTAKIKRNASTIIHNNQRGYISFEYNGYQLKGFPISLPLDDPRRTPSKITVMLHPDTDPDIEKKIFKKDNTWYQK